MARLLYFKINECGSMLSQHKSSPLTALCASATLGWSRCWSDWFLHWIQDPPWCRLNKTKASWAIFSFSKVKYVDGPSRSRDPPHLKPKAKWCYAASSVLVLRNTLASFISSTCLNVASLPCFLHLPFPLPDCKSVEQGHIHAAFVEAIRPHVPALRSSPYGKKVLSCNSLKK